MKLPETISSNTRRITEMARYAGFTLCASAACAIDVAAFRDGAELGVYVTVASAPLTVMALADTIQCYQQLVKREEVDTAS